jgi:hypothetical protein
MEQFFSEEFLVYADREKCLEDLLLGVVHLEEHHFKPESAGGEQLCV